MKRENSPSRSDAKEKDEKRLSKIGSQSSKEKKSKKKYTTLRNSPTSDRKGIEVYKSPKSIMDDPQLIMRRMTFGQHDDNHHDSARFLYNHLTKVPKAMVQAQ